MMKVKIQRIVDEALDIRSFRLVRSDGQPLDTYEPGAHVDLTGPTGVTRQYSLCSPPHDRRAYLVAVKKEAQSRGGSLALHEQVQEGMELEMGAPRNLFRLDPTATEHVLFAAGIGVTPLLSMAYQLAESGQTWCLHYFARSAEYAAFAELLASTFAGHVQFHYGVEPGDLDAALSGCLTRASRAAHVYTCGPAPFMNKVVEVAARSRSEDAIHLEHFQADPLANAGPSDGFEVELASSGVVLQVPANNSLIDVLQSHGCDIDTECREGI